MYIKLYDDIVKKGEKQDRRCAVSILSLQLTRFTYWLLPLLAHLKTYLNSLLNQFLIGYSILKTI